jgi:ankyrin repeat protein
MEILGWIFGAQRILRMDELLEALSFGEDDVAAENELSEDEKGQDDDYEEPGGEDETDEEDEDAAEADATDCELDLNGNRPLKPNEVLECCRGLVVYEESSGLVQFSHETVRTFIERELEPEHPTAINIARTCITYLASVQFDSPCVGEKSLKERAQKYKFSRYAAQFWGLHTRGEAENEPDIQRAVISLLASENKRDSMLQLETYANSSWGNINFAKGQTLLHVICKNGLATICRFILDGRNQGELQTLGLSETDTDVGVRDEEGKTALHFAADSDEWDVVKWLVEERGADIAAKDNDGQTVLHYAASRDKWDVVKWLVEERGADIAAKDNDGQTVLHLVATHGELDVVKWLVEEHSADIAAKDNYGQTVLHLVATHGELDVVKWLVEEHSADIAAKDNDGQTVLHYAATHGELDVVKWLVEEHGADIAAKDNDGQTVLHLAATRARRRYCGQGQLWTDGFALGGEGREEGSWTWSSCWRGQMTIINVSYIHISLCY